ncbi:MULTISPECIES: XRE family transcriptional regulator [Rhodoplanes]|nr:XRE family transcriptional regulator [Rhodoplanes serenus]VCU06614.1 hypothetical protein RHODPL_RHODPL_00062 [Rhodoplanes serenus]
MQTDRADRLKQARENAGLKSPREAAKRHRWNENTYKAREGGLRDFGVEEAKEYAKAFGVSWIWLVSGEEPQSPANRAPVMVPLVGYVGAGAEAYFFAGSQGELDRVDAPDGAGPNTVAVEIRGDSLGSFFDRWLVFYDDVRRPITPDLIGKLCVVGLADDRVLIKKVQRSRTKGLFHLISQFEPPILDVAVEWAAKVKHMVPR